MRALITLFFIAAVATTERSGLAHAEDAVTEKVVVKGEKKGSNPIAKAVKSVKDAVTPSSDSETPATVVKSAEGAKGVKAEKIIVVPADDDLADAPDRSYLRSSGVKEREVKPTAAKVKKHGAAEPKVVAGHDQSIEITTPKSGEVKAKVASTKSAPVKAHRADPMADDLIGEQLNDQPIISYVEESYVRSDQDPVNQAEIARQTQEVSDLESQAAGRALLTSEEALANRGVTVGDNLAQQAYLKDVARHSAESLDNTIDDSYNVSQGDMTQSDFDAAQRQGPVKSDAIVANPNGNTFLGVGGAWQKVKELFGGHKKTKPTTMVMTAPPAATSSQATGAGVASIDDLFKFKARPVSRAGSPLPAPDQPINPATFLDAGDADDQGGDDDDVVVIPVASADDE